MSSLHEDAQPVYLDTELAISQIGDAAMLPAMLGMLVESLTKDIPMISEVLAQGDVVSANRLLHPLKGFLPIFVVRSCAQMWAVLRHLAKTATVMQ